MSELMNQARPAVEKLLQSDEEQLYAELGIRLKGIERDLSLSASFAPPVTYDMAAMGPLDEVKELGKRIFRRWNAEAYKLLCGGGLEEEKDRRELREAFGISEVAVATAIAGFLVAKFALLPAVASVVAALIIKRFFRPAYDEFCEFWKEKIPAT